MWLNSERGVTGRPRVCADSGIFHDASMVLTSASRSSRCSSTMRIAAIAVTGLLIEAAWNRVEVSTARPVATSAVPYALAQCTWKSFTTAMLTPGTLSLCITWARVRLSNPCRSGTWALRCAR